MSKNKGPIYHEGCYCPETNLEKWYSSMECNQSYTQLEKDIAKFNNQSPFDMDELTDVIIKKYYKPYTHSFCNYVILNNRVSFNYNSFFYRLFLPNLISKRSIKNVMVSIRVLARLWTKSSFLCLEKSFCPTSSSSGI